MPPTPLGTGVSDSAAVQARALFFVKHSAAVQARALWCKLDSAAVQARALFLSNIVLLYMREHYGASLIVLSCRREHRLCLILREHFGSRYLAHFLRRDF